MRDPGGIRKGEAGARDVAHSCRDACHVCHSPLLHRVITFSTVHVLPPLFPITPHWRVPHSALVRAAPTELRVVFLSVINLYQYLVVLVAVMTIVCISWLNSVNRCIEYCQSKATILSAVGFVPVSLTLTCAHAALTTPRPTVHT